MIKKSLITTLILCGVTTSVLSADEFSKYLKYKTGDIIPNDEEVKINKQVRINKQNSQNIISFNNRNKEIVEENEILFKSIYPYFIRGKYNDDNSENKKDIYVMGVYSSIYFPISKYLYEFDIEKTIIKKKKSEDITQNDFSFAINTYKKNNFFYRLSLHYLKDNKDTRVCAGQYKIGRTFYKDTNKAITPYVKVSYESYKHNFNIYNKLKINQIAGIKSGLIFTLYNKLNSLSFYSEFRYHRQFKNKYKFKNSKNNSFGVKIGLTYLNNKNKLDINCFYSNEVGTMLNDGFLIGSPTNKLSKIFEISDVYFINHKHNIKLSVKHVNYKDIQNAKYNNLNLIGIMYGYNF